MKTAKFSGLIKIVFTPNAPARWAVLLLIVTNTSSDFNNEAMPSKSLYKSRPLYQLTYS